MRNLSSKRNRAKQAVKLAALTAAAAATSAVFAGESTNTSGQPTQNGIGNNAVTISLSGSTAMRNFTTSQGISFLNPGSTIFLDNGLNGASVMYTAPNTTGASFQLASGNFTAADQPVGGPFPSTNTTQVHSAIRLEWHEQGSVEGILELANDQIGYLNNTPLIDPGTRNASAGNPIWVNRNKYTTPSAGDSVGLAIAPSDYNVYSSSTYNSNGVNLQGGMNRVQMGISDVKAVQGYAVGGTGATGAFTLAPSTLGYGKGNNTTGRIGSPLTLPTNGAAVAGSFYQLHDQSALNMETSKIDPATGTSYAAGPWNSAGVNNLQSTTVAITATVFAANPGTGLDKVNRTDAQWMLTTGGLSNGASFNVSTRDVGSGTHNTMANNTGVDPSWSVGVNDSGNGNDLTPGDTAQDQLNIGSAMKFSNKTAGGGQLRPTVQNNRMSLGELGLSDAISSVQNGGGSKPLRALSYSDSTNGSTPYVTVSASSITDGSYAIWQQEQYVTVKAPNAAFSGYSQSNWANLTDASTGIKGDTPGSNVAEFRSNVLVGVAAFPNTNTVANPGDALLSQSFILPKMMQVAKPMDGVGLAVSQTNSANYDDNLRNQFLNSVYANNFNADNPATITKGSSSTYGNAGNNSAFPAGAINITNQNYLFGNFNQNGSRDFSALITAQQAQADLVNSGAGNSVFSGSANSTVIPFSGIATNGLSGMTNQVGGVGATKGDLVVMGDFNGDGKFDGKDLYLFATKAALSDNTNTTSLTFGGTSTLGDALRSGVLRKNAALDYLQSNVTAQQKLDAAVTSSADPLFTPALAQTNAFSRFDVNHDGVVDRTDAAIIDKFVGQDPTNINYQLAATITANATSPADIANTSLPQTPINLYTVKQIDGGAPVSHALVNGDSDFKQMFDHLNAGGRHVLLEGDANFNGRVDSTDYAVVVNNFGQRNQKWSQGDFNFNGRVDSTDYAATVTNFGQRADNATGSVVTAVQPATLTSSPASPSAAPTPANDRIIFDVDPSTGHVYMLANNAQLVSYEISSNSAGFIHNTNWQKLNLGQVLANNNSDVGEGVPNGGPKFVLENGQIDLGQLVDANLPASTYQQELGSLGFSAFSVIEPNGTTLFSADSNSSPGILVVGAVPEPTTLSAIAIGATALLGRRRRRQK